MSQFQTEQHTGQSCNTCGVAECTTTAVGHRMQPKGILTHTFAPRNFASGIDACPIHAEGGADHQKFINLLIACGLAQLARTYQEQVVEGNVSPEQIQLYRQEMVIYHSERTGRTDFTQEKGELSEINLELWLSDGEVFPWVRSIVRAPDNNPDYDFTIVLQPHHAVTQMLGMKHLFIDAKSSRRGVENYFLAKVRKRNKRARLTAVVQEGRWVLNTNDRLDYQLLDAQLVTMILMTVGKINQPGHWEQVFSSLHPRLKTAFYAQQALVDSMKKIILPQ